MLRQLPQAHLQATLFQVTIKLLLLETMIIVGQTPETTTTGLPKAQLLTSTELLATLAQPVT
jgi:hypothetical protein